MTEICANKVISDFDTGANYLVLWLAPGNEYGYRYNLDSRARTPEMFSVSDEIANIADNRCVVADYVPQTPYRDENSLTIAERTRRDRIWEMIRGAVECEPEIYDVKTRTALLKMVSDESGVAVSNLYNFLDQYWRSGKTKNAFLPKYHNRGAKGGARKPGEKKFGRKASDGTTSGKTLTEQDYNNFALTIKKYYLSRNKLTLKDVYEKLLGDFYSKDSTKSPGKRELLQPDEIPSERQFRYWYSKRRDAVTEQKKRDGEKAFELTGRGVTGKSDYGLMGPGAQYQIDATVGDIYLVSQFDRSNLIGRPVIYFVIDAFSRMVTGMSIALEGPSWASAMTALANMATDKVAYCKRFGIEIDENDWPCRHVPASLLGDRGEMESRNADNLVNMLGIRIVNAPPYRADLKGIIERYFRTINTKTAPLLPGSVKPDMTQRGGHDYRLDATLNILEFTEVIIRCVLSYNNHHYMDYFERSEAMISEHVKAIPAELWNWGIRRVSGALRSFPEEQVKLAVMPAAKGTVTEKGIRFKGMFFSCDKAVREAWFERARAKKSWQVDILYDPRDMANIYVRNQGETGYEPCYLLDWNSKNAGKCLDEIIYEQRKESLLGKQLKAAETEVKVNLNAEIDAIVAKAKDMARGLPEKSKHEKVSNIKENRREEREIMQATSAETDTNAALSTKQPPVSTRSDNEDDMTPRLRMIKEKAEEKLKND